MRARLSSSPAAPAATAGHRAAPASRPAPISSSSPQAVTIAYGPGEFIVLNTRTRIGSGTPIELISTLSIQ